MTPRVKKLVVAVLMLVWLLVYALLVSGFAAHYLPHANGIGAFFFYLIAGTFWAVPIGLLFPWMNREPKR